jgi:hypothetical protein
MQQGARLTCAGASEARPAYQPRKITFRDFFGCTLVYLIWDLFCNILAYVNSHGASFPHGWNEYLQNECLQCVPITEKAKKATARNLRV